MVGRSKKTNRNKSRIDETVVTDSFRTDAGPVHVTWWQDDVEQTQTFSEPFTIGRDPDCDVTVENTSVSRTHVKVSPVGGQWHVEDLDSGNGTFLDTLRVHEAVLPMNSTLQLGDTIKLRLKVPEAAENITDEEIVERYFGDTAEHELGDKTLRVRAAYRQIDMRQKLRYHLIISAIAAALIVTIGLGVFQHVTLQKTRELATEIFYSMKKVEVQVARMEDVVRDSGDAELIDEARKRREEVKSFETQYDRFLAELDVLGPGLSEEDRVILRVARMLGECELTMPEGFTGEVKNYILRWQATNQLQRALQRMQRQDLTEVLAEAMLENHLPPQFLYVALKESGFDSQAIGPKTRSGIAKGMWQFMPTTARHYGLRTGPLVELPMHDPNDQRFEPELATQAAARYLRDIYSHEAQASGLLVIASYNWGPNNVRKRILDMPNNPRERNFWQLLKEHDIPAETYDYVMYIFSAIVIGEDPALFGFDFDNPLVDIDTSLGAVQI
jgi:hypothetical protein